MPKKNRCTCNNTLERALEGQRQCDHVREERMYLLWIEVDVTGLR